MGYTYTKKSYVYLKFKFNWESGVLSGSAILSDTQAVVDER